MSETIEPPVASPAPPSASPPPFPPPQTSHVFVDRPCAKCGYNLRGQTATWNRRALNWQVTCPECGSAQVIVIGNAGQRGLQNPMLALAMAVLGGWIVWQLLSWLAASHAMLMEAPLGMPPGFNVATPARVRAAQMAAARLTVLALDAEWTTLASHLVLRLVPVVLAALLIGMIIALAPYAKSRQRNVLLVILILGACVYGGYSNLVPLDTLNSVQARIQLAQAMNSGLLTGVTATTDWRWLFVSGTIGMLVALTAGRIGLATGGPLGRMIASMYVRTDA